ncbi:amino acid adenylation domain-containing protein [Chitinophaga eiseniae]|uniref:Amino acid adenylation domain-containing protein n=1 Tax=Chitinophaga eiseniae TaxID=634771 RepID=A0A1T4T955_9BACT|nr:non-ribosomal peptide synthetase [Chitinophaga eiseniae]SKA37110.1 amino acid adenylation domain-containing protein [Chitinophaga eiseniae]
MPGFNLSEVVLILEQAQDLGIGLSLDGDELLLKTAQQKPFAPSFLQTLKENKTQLVAYFKASAAAAATAPATEKIRVAERPAGSRIPLSFSQERLWFIDALEGSVQYHVPAVLKLKGTVDTAALEQALRTIVDRHEVLRTVIGADEDGTWQQSVPGNNWRLDIIDGAGDAGDTAALQARIAALIHQPFDLATDYMLRAHLVTLRKEEAILVLTMHHIASDGWSSSILVHELMEGYSAFTKKRDPRYTPLDIQYADYAIWQRKYLSGATLEQKIDHWKNKLQDVTMAEIPADFERPATGSTHGAFVVFNIAGALAAALRQLAQQEGATLYMVLLAAFKVLVHRYSGQEDICVGGAVAGRTRTELEPLIGFFVNTLALRTDLGGNPSFQSVLQRVKNTLLDAFEYEDAPFEKVVEAVVKERDRNRNPLFQSVFVLQNVPAVPEWRIGDVVITEEPVIRNASLFDLTWIAEERGEEISIYLEYSTDLFRENTIRKLFSHYETLLAAIVKDPAQAIGQLEMLAAHEKQQLLTDFNATAFPYPAEKTITALFDEQVTQTPEAIALAFGETQLTYAQLQAQSDKLAAYLQSKGVKAETMVPLCMERSAQLIVSILAILKAGGAYVPVDPAYPRDRIRFMLEDTRPVIILTESAQLPALREHVPAIEMVCVDQLMETLADAPAPVTSANPGSLAYIIYTSGSTGQPKGVMVTHRNVTSLARGGNFMTLNAEDVLLSTGSPSFDATTIEYWGMLLNGGQLVLCPEKHLLDNPLLKQEIRRRGVTKMWFTASWFNQLVDDDIAIFEGLNALMVGGEKLSEEHIRKFREAYPATAIINGYGPTENTTFSLTWHITAVEPGINIPIGRPLGNRTAYVLSAEGQLQPAGVAGELYVGGDGVSRGYLNQPGLTAQKFIPDPFSSAPGARLYRTGDLACWLPDGAVAYLGRIDDQVKIHGHRIEPGEIESVLLQHPGVKQAVVLMQVKATGDKYLAGYIVPQRAFDKAALADYLKGRLPAYMVPAQLVVLDKMPLTSNGKADKKALRALTDDNTETQVYTAPVNETEQQLVTIWERFLQKQQISTTANFFELGGHSLLASRVVTAIRNTLGVELSITRFFRYPTVSKLAAHLTGKAKESGWPAIVAGKRPPRIPLAFSQERLWFIDQMNGTLAYHVPLAVRLKGTLDEAGLSFALQTIVDRHEALRTVIRQEHGVPYQQLLEVDGWELAKISGNKFSTPEALQAHLIELVNTPFDLAEDYMLRASLVRLSVDEHILLITVHHIACDGWSVTIMVNDIAELYNAYIEKRPAALAPLPLQFADYAVWQRSLAENERLQKQLSYWEQQLNGVEVLQLPTDFSRPAIQSTKGAVQRFALDAALSEQLRQFSLQQDVTLFMTLLAAFKVLLYRYSGQEDICVGSSIAGRTQEEVTGLVGFFVNTLALRSDLSRQPTFLTLLQQVKQTTLAAYDHQEVPFEKVVEAVNTDRDLSRTPLFQVLFELQNTPAVDQVQLGALDVTREDLKYNTAQFDLVVSMEEGPDGLTGFVEYGTEIFREETITQLMTHFSQLLATVLSLPDTRINKLPLLTEAERHQQLVTFNNTTVDFPHNSTLIDLITLQAQCTPAAPALAMGDEVISYASLEERSNQLAHYLREMGVNDTSLVPVCLDRSPEMVIAILSIMKAGGAYLPIDPGYPEDRVAYMLQDSKAKMVISRSADKQKPAQAAAVRIISLDEEAAVISGYPTTALAALPVPSQLAYVIYTSGSTGLPKGAMIEHAGMLNHLYAKVNDLRMDATAIVAFTAAFTFDISVWQMFSALLCGGYTIIYPTDTILQPVSLMQAVEKDKVTILEVVPSYLSAILATVKGVSLRQLKYLLVTGETLPRQLVAEWFQHEANRTIPVVNAYGPTEASDDITHHVMYEAPEQGNVPLGKPIQNLQIYVLDASMQLCPIGVAGEICVSGIGVGRGYLNRPELTAEKFVHDPFREEDGVRMYRTGDLGKWLPDGTVVHLGRIDDQVKVRGYRIELGEIERVIEKSGMVKQVVVITKADQYQQLQLVGYVVGQEHFDKDELLGYLKTKLPEYMVPVQWVMLTEMPLSANGKINRKALPETEMAATSADLYVAPTNELEEKLADICARLLEVQRVSIYDNLFEIGMHSLLIMRLAATVHEDFGLQVSVRTFFQLTTIAALAKYIGVNKTPVAAPTAKQKKIIL